MVRDGSIHKDVRKKFVSMQRKADDAVTVGDLTRSEARLAHQRGTERL